MRIKKAKRWVPRVYQMVAVCFLLLRPRSGLFLDPGLGKTAITLCVLRILKRLGGKKNRPATLLICPKSVMWLTWPNEIKKWSNFNSLTYCVLHGDMKEYLLWNAKADIYLINPAGLPWLNEALLKGLRRKRPLPFNILWVDESTKFKSHTAKTLFLCLRDMLPLFKRRHIMTGTPTAKAYEDLWAQVYIMDRGEALGAEYKDFRNEYFNSLASLMTTVERKKLDRRDFRWGKYVVRKGIELEDVLSRAISHLVLNMSEEDYLDLPPITFNQIRVQLPPQAQAHYNQLEKDAITYVEEEKVGNKNAIGAMIPCWQVANGCVYEAIPEHLTEEEIKEFKKTRKVLQSHTHKIDALVNLVEELNGKPLFIIYWFKHDLAAIRKALGAKIPNLGAETGRAETVQIERDWNSGKIPLLTGHPDRIAHGLNMQDGPGRDMAFFSLFWSPENRRQAIKRIHRSGVDSRVTIHDFIAINTIDEVMVARWATRQNAEKKLRALLNEYYKDKLANGS